MSVQAQISEFVRSRAGNRCEYCLMHQSLQGATFHVEHVQPRSRGGLTEPDNLALARPSCNFHKADQTMFEDPQTGDCVPLFNPRQDAWDDHVLWRGYRIDGKTPIGRATISKMHFNSERRLQVRQAEEVFNLFPP